MNGLADTRIEPTPLQKDVIPAALQGKNMLVKNEAEEDGVFLIPALQKLSSNGEVSGTKILILTPSVERAKQIDELVWALGYHAQISSASLSMKGNRAEQEQAVKDGAPVIVANPGRLIEILNKNKLNLPDLELVIIDEAQDMENYNLVNRVKDILKYVEGNPQYLIFSKDYNKATSQLTHAILDNPEIIGFELDMSDESKSESDSDSATKDSSSESGEKNARNEKDSGEDQEQEQDENKEQDTSATDESGSGDQPEEEEEPYVLDMEEVKRKLEAASVDVVLNPEEQQEEDDSSEDEDTEDSGEEPTVPKNLEQAYIYVPPRAKISTLLAHLEDTLTDQIVVFAASKRTTDRLFRIIRKKGWGVVSINEGLDEQTYNDRFSKFTSGDMKILLVGGISATEVELEYAKQVINYDVPSEVEEYKYRAELVGNGKAARMVSLVSKMDRDDIDKIVEQVGYAPTEIPLPEEVKEKKKKGGNGGRKNNNKKNNKNKNKNNNDKDRDRRRRRKPKKKKKRDHGLPIPTYDGLKGGKEGKGKRPSPSEGGGAFGWIKKLFD